MSAALTVTTQKNGDGTIEVAAVGELDLSTVDRFQSAIQDAATEAGPDQAMTLDLRGVEYLDSAAINVLFAHAARISLVRVHPLVLRGLTISGLDQVVAVQSADLD